MGPSSDWSTGSDFTRASSNGDGDGEEEDDDEDGTGYSGVMTGGVTRIREARGEIGVGEDDLVVGGAVVEVGALPVEE